jgi:hypothetical protein
VKKPYKYTERTEDVRCVRCDRPLKRSVVERKANRPRLCYACHRESRKEG